MRWTVFLLVLMVGCSAHTQVNYGVPPGTSVTQSSVQLNVQGGSAAVALVVHAGGDDAESDQCDGRRHVRHGALSLAARRAFADSPDQRAGLHQADRLD